jgi:hypothetical protein
MFIDFEVFNFHCVSMSNMNSLKILDSWFLRFNLCWFAKFIIFFFLNCFERLFVSSRMCCLCLCVFQGDFVSAFLEYVCL